MATAGVLTLADQHEQLLPGIPDEITVNEICTKLPWRAVFVLSSVSPRWHRATRSREIYEARVRSKSTETLVVLGRSVSSKCFAFELYSLREKACYQLPWLTQVEGGPPWSCECVSLDGKIYAMGRVTDQSTRSGDMCVLDVASHWGWRNTANMQVRRENFGCGVLDGKIYVVGGIFRDSDGECQDSGSEVYDPDTNVWSSIPPTKSVRSGHHVAAMGDELYVYGGWCTRGANYRPGPLPLEIYHPTRNEWRQVEFNMQRFFIAHGKIYCVKADEILVHDDDIEKDSWKMVHSFEQRVCHRRNSCAFEAVGDEVVDFSYHPEDSTDTRDLCLRQSKGFASTTKKIVWETVKLRVSKYPEPPRFFMCTVEL